jgi:hypothetical protein
MNRHFVEHLFQKREVPLAMEAPPMTVDSRDYCLKILEQQYREDLLHHPEGAPSFDGEAAMTGVEIVHDCARALLYREISGEEASRIGFRLEGQSLEQWGVYWGLDLGLRFLPAIYRQAVRIAREDPLCIAMRELFRRHALCSVGSGECPDDNLALVEDTPFLQKVMVERIMNTGDPAWQATDWFQSRCPSWHRLSARQGT